MVEKIPSINAQVESIALAFCELAKMLGKNEYLAATQLAASLESKAKAATTSAETKTAFGELARRLRNPWSFDGARVTVIDQCPVLPRSGSQAGL